MEFVDHLWRLIIEKFGHAAAFFVVSIVGALVWILGRYLLRLLKQAWCFVQSRNRALRAVARSVTRDGAHEGQGVWLTTPIHQPEHYRQHVTNSKTLAVANLKGGVGKTTLAANIGAFIASEWEKRVLLIDLDFQGSLSSMAFAGKDWLRGRRSSLAAKLISDDIRPDLVPEVAQKIELKPNENGQGELKIITAYYDLAQADNRIMVEWLLQCRHRIPESFHQALVEILAGKLFRTRDVRYTLAELLHSDAVQRAFDLIIIDSPPRLTTSEIQAFCASSHLLIPTIFDRTSAEAVGSLCDQIEILRSAGVCPHLEYIGVVGTMWKADRIAQRNAMTLVRDALGNGPTGILPPQTFIPHAAALVNDADEGIAYVAMPNRQDLQPLRDAVAALATYVAGQMGIRQPQEFQQAAE